jgi:uncharacterized OsmC-like protein
MNEETGLIKPNVDPDKPMIGVRDVKAHNDATCRTVVTVRGHEQVCDEKDGTNTGPTPLETVLGGLASCEAVMIFSVTEALGYKYDTVDFDIQAEVDGRGSRGVRGVRPYFNWVKMKVTITSNDIDDKKLVAVKKNAEARCPVMNLMIDAGVDVETDWNVVSG